MMLYRLRCMRLTLLTTLSFAGGPGAGVWEGQRCGYRGRSLRSEDGRTTEAALPIGQGSGRLAGRGLADGMERVRVAAF